MLNKDQIVNDFIFISKTVRSRLVQIHLQGVGAALRLHEDHAEPRAGQVVFDDLNAKKRNTFY